MVSKKKTPIKALERHVAISPPNYEWATFEIEGVSAYVQLAFSAKTVAMMKAKQEAGARAKNTKKKTARDFDADYDSAIHRSTEGWPGIPAAAFRNAMISACRICGYTMTKAKISLFCVADGVDKESDTGMVKITKGEPRMRIDHVRNATGVADLRARAMWDAGWRAKVKIRYDADQFGMEDVANLLARVGMQVGVGEGRHDSKQSAGMGWGEFKVLGGKLTVQHV
ncbi:hypothetical protein HQ590_06800 [bacterium]|nr:hypothetical protein [bacterium]